MSISVPVSKRESLVVLAAVLIGGWLRGHGLLDVGLSHFDEGIYAITSVASVEAPISIWDLLVAQGYYSPPAFALQARILCGLVGPTDLGVLLVSWFWGTGTVALAWWVARNLFNQPLIGLTAAWVVAVDGMLIVFSRSGLTDATFGFFFLLGAYLSLRALEEGGWQRLIAAGVVVGFTWNIKYNGPLALVVALGTLWDAQWRQKLLRFIWVGATAFGCYAPWALLFHVKQGYGSLVEHHRGYITGPAAWVSNWAVALNNSQQLATWATPLVLCAACIAIGKRKGLGWASAFGMLGTSLVAPLGWVVFAVLGCTKALASFRWPLLVGVGILLVIPANYSPYFRLWLPTRLWLILGVAGAIGHLIEVHGRFREKLLPWILAAVGAAAHPIMGSIPKSLPVYPPTTGYENAARQLAEWHSNANSPPLVGLTRPPLRFYLAFHGVSIRPMQGTIAELEDLNGVNVIVLDHAFYDSVDSFQLRLNKETETGRFTQEASFRVEPSLPTILDDMGATNVTESDGLDSRYQVRVLRRQ